jgi:hypothetical protein
MICDSVSVSARDLSRGVAFATAGESRYEDQILSPFETEDPAARRFSDGPLPPGCSQGNSQRLFTHGCSPRVQIGSQRPRNASPVRFVTASLPEEHSLRLFFGELTHSDRVDCLVYFFENDLRRSSNSHSDRDGLLKPRFRPEYFARNVARRPVSKPIPFECVRTTGRPEP